MAFSVMPSFSANQPAWEQRFRHCAYAQVPNAHADGTARMRHGDGESILPSWLIAEKLGITEKAIENYRVHHEEK